MKSLGLEVTGSGSGAEVWYVGSGEQKQDEKDDAGAFVGPVDTSSGEQDDEQIVQ